MQKTIMHGHVLTFNVNEKRMRIYSVGCGEIICELHYQYPDGEYAIAFILESMRCRIIEIIENAIEEKYVLKIVNHLK